MREGFTIERNRAALLVIDMMKYFCDETSSACVGEPNMLIAGVVRLVNAFVKARRPVVYTRHIDVSTKRNMMVKWWQENISPRDPLSELIDELETSKGTVLIKHQYDAFFRTRLERFLLHKRVEQVVICGVLTNLCCETTARSAFMRGFEVYFTDDATRTYTRAMHDATLLNLGYGFATIVQTADVLAVME
jgi:bifunctional isochorismate lyase/aryl carrier protein